MESVKKYTDLIANLDEMIEYEYEMNLDTLVKSKDAVEQAIEDSKKDGFDNTYFSTKIEFEKESKEIKEHAIAGGCVRMIVFKKWILDTFGIENVDVDIVKLDNYVTYIRAIINHGL